MSSAFPGLLVQSLNTHQRKGQSNLCLPPSTCSQPKQCAGMIGMEKSRQSILLARTGWMVGQPAVLMAWVTTAAKAELLVRLGVSRAAAVLTAAASAESPPSVHHTCVFMKDNEPKVGFFYCSSTCHYIPTVHAGLPLCDSVHSFAALQMLQCRAGLSRTIAEG